ncbi:MAG TPA: hypothetical protein VH414_17230 [Lichenihabitans sp.]|jgi:hypothetical protein|nr:hypothetical protein [Lichenihabitans sp.]
MSGPEAVDAACRDAIKRYRLDAFDNVDTDALLQTIPLPPDRAIWMGDSLMRHGRSLEACKAGQHILSLMNAVDVA